MLPSLPTITNMWGGGWRRFSTPKTERHRIADVISAMDNYRPETTCACDVAKNSSSTFSGPLTDTGFGHEQHPFDRSENSLSSTSTFSPPPTLRRDIYRNRYPKSTPVIRPQVICRPDISIRRSRPLPNDLTDNITCHNPRRISSLGGRLPRDYYR